jgi:hypothetical protein
LKKGPDKKEEKPEISNPDEKPEQEKHE